MGRVKLAVAVALAAGAAACNQDDSGNVMGSSGSSLTNAQVDAALGPEIAVPDANEALEAAEDGIEAGAANQDDESASVNAADESPAGNNVEQAE